MPPGSQPLAEPGRPAARPLACLSAGGGGPLAGTLPQAAPTRPLACGTVRTASACGPSPAWTRPCGRSGTALRPAWGHRCALHGGTAAAGQRPQRGPQALGMCAAPGSPRPQAHPPPAPASCSFSHDSKYLAITSDDRSLDIEDLESGACVYQGVCVCGWAAFHGPAPAGSACRPGLLARPPARCACLAARPPAGSYVGRFSLTTPAESCSWNPSTQLLAFPGDLPPSGYADGRGSEASWGVELRWPSSSA
jgi:hypothetical protein